MTFQEVIEFNNQKIEQYKKENNSQKVLLHEKIAKLLSERPALFFEINMESALKILAQIIPEEQLKEAYISLISPENFGNLRRKFNIFKIKRWTKVHFFYFIDMI